jgi:hypothetical protein
MDLYLTQTNFILSEKKRQEILANLIKSDNARRVNGDFPDAAKKPSTSPFRRVRRNGIAASKLPVAERYAVTAKLATREIMPGW